MNVAKNEEKVCEKRLKRLGYELVDLGTDFESPAHLYCVFDTRSCMLVSNSLLTLDDIERFIASKKKK